MPVNEFNIGKDVSLDIVDPQLGPQRFSIHTGWEATPDYNEMESKSLDGVPRFDNVPHGWRVTFRFDRADPNVDNYFAAREAAYFNGQVVPLVTITETIRERNGGISQFRYTGVALRLTGGGSWSGDGITTQSVEGRASRRHKVA